MIGVLLLAQQEIGRGFLAAAEHVLGRLPTQVEALPVNYEQTPEQLTQALDAALKHLEQGQGVLILADVYGATHTNVACRFLRADRIELVAGLNLPMLIRVLNYRDLDLPAVVRKAMSGGTEGIVRAAAKAHALEMHG